MLANLYQDRDFEESQSRSWTVPIKQASNDGANTSSTQASSPPFSRTLRDDKSETFSHQLLDR